MENPKPTEKSDSEKIIEELRITRIHVVELIAKQQKTIFETQKWGIILTILLSISVAIKLYILFRFFV